jgi:hypothetical protein
MRLGAGFLPRRPRFESRLHHVGFVMDKVALGQIFFQYFGFPCQFSSHRLLHADHLTPGAGTIGQLVTDVTSGLSLTPPQKTKKIYSEHESRVLTHYQPAGRRTCLVFSMHVALTPSKVSDLRLCVLVILASPATIPVE